MFRPQTFLALGLALALALTFGTTKASADTFDLNFDHASGEVGPVSPPYGTVTLSGGGTSVTIVYTANTSAVTGFHEIGFNYVASGGSTITNISITDNSSLNTFPSLGSPEQFDGLGNFTYGFGNPGGGANNQATVITVTITGTNLSLANFEQLSGVPPGDTQAYFVAAFARTNLNGSVTTGDVGATQAGAVPEPSTMAIAGLGALGFIGYGLRRRLKK